MRNVLVALRWFGALLLAITVYIAALFAVFAALKPIGMVGVTGYSIAMLIGPLMAILIGPFVVEKAQRRSATAVLAGLSIVFAVGVMLHAVLIDDLRVLNLIDISQSIGAAAIAWHLRRVIEARRPSLAISA